MSDEQCQKIHWASLEVMESIGLCLYDPEALSVEVAEAVHAIVERAEAHYV
jgi:hypothetical protein